MATAESGVRDRLSTGVLTLTLDRPEQRNALDRATMASLREHVNAAAQQPAVGLIVITGTGAVFSAGADLKEASGLSSRPADFRRMLHEWRATFASFAECPKPVLAAVNGLAIAGGLELALATDAILASSAARFGDGHIRYGLLPGGGMTQRLPQAVGSRMARWLMFSGEIVGAEQAERAGLVQKVIPAERFESELAEITSTLATRSPVALSFMKSLTRMREVSDDLVQLELEAVAHLIAGPHAQEGLAAFRERREPVFPRSATDRRS